jgi:hypothetical protein
MLDGGEAGPDFAWTGLLAGVFECLFRYGLKCTRAGKAETIKMLDRAYQDKD